MEFEDEFEDYNEKGRFWLLFWNYTVELCSEDVDWNKNLIFG